MPDELNVKSKTSDSITITGADVVWKKETLEELIANNNSMIAQFQGNISVLEAQNKQYQSLLNKIKEE